MMVSMPGRSAAPEGHRIVDFLNTAYLPEGDDALADERATGWLTDWLGTGAPASTTAGAGDEVLLQRLREVREGLRQFAVANNGEPPDEETIDRAAVALGSLDLVLDIGDQDRGPRMMPSANAGAVTVTERALVVLAECYLKARLGENWLRVKACASADCRYAFLDTSRNRSRRWCEMAYCGNRAKNRAWRQRSVNARPDR